MTHQTIRKQKREPASAQREVRITNRLGLHARPAAQFVKCARSFRSEIWVVNHGKKYSADSLIDVLRANLDCGATATLKAYGADAEEAIERLAELLAEFDEHDEP
jgi:phosphocarrier protein HPr